MMGRVLVLLSFSSSNPWGSGAFRVFSGRGADTKRPSNFGRARAGQGTGHRVGVWEYTVSWCIYYGHVSSRNTALQKASSLCTELVTSLATATSASDRTQGIAPLSYRSQNTLPAYPLCSEVNQ